MHLDKLRSYFDTAPALRLLRSPNAPFIIDFLDQQFKRPGRIAIPYSELVDALAIYREKVQSAHADALRDKPETYLSNWCSDDSRWLRRLIESGRNEPVFQLTTHSEDVFAFLDRVIEQDLGFVATDSRLRLVIQTLADLVVGASDDPAMRLAHLEHERQRIDSEIERIRTDGSVGRYQPAQIRERFATAVGLLKQLQGDFRAVEEKFKQITAQVQQRQNAGRDSRGGILQFALDSEDVLKREDQGVSFYEFVRFILSPSQQEKLQEIIQRLGEIQELAEHGEGLETVRRMVPLLLAEAEKVMRTNQRLSATLRRLLDMRSARERQRVAQLLREIRGLAASLGTAPLRETVYLETETGVEIKSPLARSFWSEPPRFEKVDLTERAADDDRRFEAFRALASYHRLDWRNMRSRVKDTVARGGSSTLGGLLDEYPPEAGVVEVLGYLQIAREDGHLIRQDAVEEIVLPQSDARRAALAVTVPLVTFIAH